MVTGKGGPPYVFFCESIIKTTKNTNWLNMIIGMQACYVQKMSQNHARTIQRDSCIIHFFEKRKQSSLRFYEFCIHYIMHIIHPNFWACLLVCIIFCFFMLVLIFNLVLFLLALNLCLSNPQNQSSWPVDKKWNPTLVLWGLLPMNNLNKRG